MYIEGTSVYLPVSGHYLALCSRLLSEIESVKQPILLDQLHSIFWLDCSNSTEQVTGIKDGASLLSGIGGSGKDEACGWF